VQIFAGVSLKRGVKRQCGCRKRQFLVLSLTISSEVLVARPALLYSRPIVQSLADFTLTPKYVTTLSDCKGHFTLNSVLSSSTFTESVIISILGINNIFIEGHTRWRA